MPVLILHEADIRINTVARDKVRHYIIIKGWTQQENTVIFYMYTPKTVLQNAFSTNDKIKIRNYSWGLQHSLWELIELLDRKSAMM